MTSGDSARSTLGRRKRGDPPKVSATSRAVWPRLRREARLVAGSDASSASPTSRSAVAPPTRILGRFGASMPVLGVLVLLGASLLALLLAPLALAGTYSWIEFGVSESAGQGVDGAWVARFGFLFFGAAVLWLAEQRFRVWGPMVTLLHAVFGASMFGVATFATRSWDEAAPFVESEDWLHSFFATTMGFGFILALVFLVIARRERSVQASLPDLIPLFIALAVPLLMWTSIWGLLQRTMFGAAYFWYGHQAWLIRHGPNDGRMEATDPIA